MLTVDFIFKQNVWLGHVRVENVFEVCKSKNTPQLIPLFYLFCYYEHGPHSVSPEKMSKPINSLLPHLSSVYY